MRNNMRALVVELIVAILAVAIFTYNFHLLRIPPANDEDNQRANPGQDSDIFEEVFLYPKEFLQYYADMEKNLKIFTYLYEDDDFLHFILGHINGKFSSEVFFHYNLIFSRFLTSDPNEASLYFIPLLLDQIDSKAATFNEYFRFISHRNPYWNRNQGRDHFLVTCHKAAARVLESAPLNESIRVLCSVTRSSGHDIGHWYHHLSLPQIQLPFAFPAGGNDTRHRKTLAYWVGRDKPEQKRFYTSKYCICYGASHVTRICITDSIHYGCIPVILYDNYDLPFRLILDWTKFSILLYEDDAHLVEQFLESIPDSEFNRMQNNLVKVQRHFQWNSSSRRYDLFHMIMFELWFRHVLYPRVFA